MAAIIVEPVQGDGGFLPAPVKFMRALREVTRRHGIVLIVDEIQTGFGRTGEMFGFQHSGIEPDLLTTAKSLAGGLPMSAVVGKAHIMDAPLPGGMGGTYGGNALACAAALAVIDAFEEEDLVARGVPRREHDPRANAAVAGALAAVGDVRGSARCSRSSCVTDRRDEGAGAASSTTAIIDEAPQRGLILLKAGVDGSCIRVLCPLSISDGELDEGLAAWEDALVSVLG